MQRYGKNHEQLASLLLVKATVLLLIMSWFDSYCSLRFDIQPSCALSPVGAVVAVT